MDYFLWNELPTCLGNIVGGITFVGAMIYSTHFKTSPKRGAQKSADSTLAGAVSR
jgi:formate/nitrite transporter FocA (FNT family)